MLSRLFGGSTASGDASKTATPPVIVQHIHTPEEHIAKAIKFSGENNFTQCLSHLTSFATSWTGLLSPLSLNPSPPLSQQEKLKIGGQLEDLNQITRRKLEDHLRGDDHITVCCACRILSCLQSLQPNPSSANDEGLDTYLDFLEKIIHKDATEYMKLLVEASDTSTSASVLADLFSLAGSIIHDALPLVQPFSRQAGNQLVGRVHKQCSSHATTIFDLFSEELSLTDTVQQLQTQSQSPTSEYASSLMTNPLQLDETLQTISVMCAYSARYITFIQTKSTSTSTSTSAPSTSVPPTSTPSTVDCGALQTSIQIMLGHYLALESFYLDKAMTEAIKSHQELLMATFNVERNNSSAINTSTTTSTNTTAAPITVPTTPPRPQHVRGTYTADSAPNKTLTNPFSFSSSPSTSTTNEPNKNTLVDDGFFIIKKCLRRGLSTMSSNVACAMINSASMILEAPYFASFENVIARLMVLHATTDTYLELLNDLELSLEYLVKLQRDMAGNLYSLSFELLVYLIVFLYINRDIARLYPTTPEKTKLIACLDDLVKSSTQYCNKLRNRNLVLYSDKLNTTIESNFMVMFRLISYELDENTYEQAEINDPFMLRFLDFLAELLLPVQLKLRDANRAEVALNLAKFISGKFESAVYTKRFTSLGAVQLSKEIRQLGDYFASIGGQPLRYQFTKLAQISQLLNLDRVIDCMEYWIEGKAVFKLDAKEVRQVLTRRIDFSIESINALKL